MGMKYESLPVHLRFDPSVFGVCPKCQTAINRSAEFEGYTVTESGTGAVEAYVKVFCPSCGFKVGEV